MSKLKDLEKQYTDQANKRKDKIRQEPNKWKRFWKWVWYLIAFPFIWIWYNVRDWRTFLIFGIVVLVVGVEVWLPLLLSFIFYGTEFSAWCLGIAGACELFWLAPFTPFIPLCICITIAVKEIFNRIKLKKK